MFCTTYITYLLFRKELLAAENMDGPVAADEDGPAANVDGPKAAGAGVSAEVSESATVSASSGRGSILSNNL